MQKTSCLKKTTPTRRDITFDVACQGYPLNLLVDTNVRSQSIYFSFRDLTYPYSFLYFCQSSSAIRSLYFMYCVSRHYCLYNILQLSVFISPHYKPNVLQLSMLITLFIILVSLFRLDICYIRIVTVFIHETVTLYFEQLRLSLSFTILVSTLYSKIENIAAKKVKPLLEDDNTYDEKMLPCFKPTLM